jgi:hypothetical protein
LECGWETSQQPLFLKIEFGKAFDRVDWNFITDMLTCVGFRPRCVTVVNTLFTNTSAFVLVNNSLSLHFFLH